MKHLFIRCSTVLLLFVACSPQNDKVKNEHIRAGAPQKILDTMANTRKDGTRTDGETADIALPMPQSVIQALEKKYPGWREPHLKPLPQEFKQANGQEADLVKGDFNGDRQQDYALQLQYQEHLIIAVALSTPNKSYTIHELMRDTFANYRGQLRSHYNLSLLPVEDKLTKNRTGYNPEAPHDAILVNTDSSSTNFTFRNGKFTRIPSTK